MIYESDLYFLKTLFFPDVDMTLVLDPGNKVKNNIGLDYQYIRSREDFQLIDELEMPFLLINLSGARIDKFPFKKDNVAGVISFNRKPEFLEEQYTHQLQVIENPDNDTIRWIFPSKMRKPHFLDIYDNDISQTIAFRWFTSFFMKIGKPQFLADFPLYIIRKEEHPLPHLKDTGFSQFAINTAHLLKDAYVTIQLIFEDKNPEYIKLALDKYSSGRLKNESIRIKALEDKKPETFRFPHVRLEENMLYLSNIPHKVRKGVMEPSRYLVKILEEIYSLDHSEETIESIFKFHRILDKLFLIEKAMKNGDIPRGLHHIHLAKAYKGLVKLLNSFSLDKRIKVGLANRNFNSWNLEKLEDHQYYIYSWDRAIDHTPLMYDLFEFIIQLEEDENHPGMENFSLEFDKIMEENYTVELMEKFKLDLELYFKLFLLIRITDEIFHLMEKPILPYQSNFRVLFWNDILRNVV